VPAASSSEEEGERAPTSHRGRVPFLLLAYAVRAPAPAIVDSATRECTSIVAWYSPELSP
jgi:hypothetical protein